MEAHVQAVNEAVLEANGYSKEEEADSEEEVWDGIVEDQVPRLNREDEYVDEEKYTTVIVEEVGISKDGLVRLEDESKDGEHEAKNIIISESSRDRMRTPANGAGKKQVKEKTSKVKKKKRNFRYENKAERNIVRMKERSKNSAHAMARKRKK